MLLIRMSADSGAGFRDYYKCWRPTIDLADYAVRLTTLMVSFRYRSLTKGLRYVVVRQQIWLRSQIRYQADPAPRDGRWGAAALLQAWRRPLPQSISNRSDMLSTEINASISRGGWSYQ